MGQKKVAGSIRERGSQRWLWFKILPSPVLPLVSSTRHLTEAVVVTNNQRRVDLRRGRHHVGDEPCSKKPDSAARLTPLLLRHNGTERASRYLSGESGCVGDSGDNEQWRERSRVLVWVVEGRRVIEQLTG